MGKGYTLCPPLSPLPTPSLPYQLSRFYPSPQQGVRLAVEAARPAYEQHGAGGALQLYVQPGVGHECTAEMWGRAAAWLDRHLLPQA